MESHQANDSRRKFLIKTGKVGAAGAVMASLPGRSALAVTKNWSPSAAASMNPSVDLVVVATNAKSPSYWALADNWSGLSLDPLTPLVNFSSVAGTLPFEGPFLNSFLTIVAEDCVTVKSLGEYPVITLFNNEINFYNNNPLPLGPALNGKHGDDTHKCQQTDIPTGSNLIDSDYSGTTLFRIGIATMCNAVSNATAGGEVIEYPLTPQQAVQFVWDMVNNGDQLSDGFLPDLTQGPVSNFLESLYNTP
jgi:hypothetical protein